MPTLILHDLTLYDQTRSYNYKSYGTPYPPLPLWSNGNPLLFLMPTLHSLKNLNYNCKRSTVSKYLWSKHYTLPEELTYIMLVIVHHTHYSKPIFQDIVMMIYKRLLSFETFETFKPAVVTMELRTLAVLACVAVGCFIGIKFVQYDFENICLSKIIVWIDRAFGICVNTFAICIITGTIHCWNSISLKIITKMSKNPPFLLLLSDAI